MLPRRDLLPEHFTGAVLAGVPQGTLQHTALAGHHHRHHPLCPSRPQPQRDPPQLLEEKLHPRETACPVLAWCLAPSTPPWDRTPQPPTWQSSVLPGAWQDQGRGLWKEELR